MTAWYFSDQNVIQGTNERRKVHPKLYCVPYHVLLLKNAIYKKNSVLYIKICHGDNLPKLYKEIGFHNIKLNMGFVINRINRID